MAQESSPHQESTLTPGFPLLEEEEEEKTVTKLPQEKK